MNQKREILNDPKAIEAFKCLVDYKGMEETVMRNLAVARAVFVTDRRVRRPAGRLPTL